MSRVILPTDLNDILADLSRRVDNLETGGKPIAKVADEASGSSGSVSAGSQTLFTSTISWSDATVEEALLAIPHWVLYVDTDDDITQQYGGGSNVAEENHLVLPYLDQASLEADNFRSRFRLFVQNQDSVAHEYFLHIQFLYISASSGSSGT